VKVAFFGKLGEAIGREVEVDCQTDSMTVADLRILLSQLYPGAAGDLLSPRIRACVDDLMVGEEFRLPKQSTVEFFPPLSGG
jgi:molybdopterin converting factor small subunit